MGEAGAPASASVPASGGGGSSSSSSSSSGAGSAPAREAPRAAPDAARDAEVRAHWKQLSVAQRRAVATVRRKPLCERVRTTFCSRCYGLAVQELDRVEREGVPEGAAADVLAGADDNGKVAELELLSEGKAAWGVLAPTGEGGACVLNEAHLQDGGMSVIQRWRARRAARQRHYAEFGDVCGGDWVRLKAGAKVCSLHSRRMSCEALHRQWMEAPRRDRDELLRMSDEDFVERLDHHLRQNICSDCRGNVTRAFKEIKDLRRLPGGCRCNDAFCAPDQNGTFWYEFTADSVSACWEAHVSNPEKFEWRWALGTLPGTTDVLPFAPTADGGRAARLEKTGLKLARRHYCLSVCGTGPDGHTVAIQGRATAVDEPCVHRYVLVGSGEVRLDTAESAMDTFQRAEEVLEEIEEEEAFEPEDRKRMHAETPELARDTLADAAALIFTERIQNTICERCAQDNAAGLVTHAAVELIEERVWAAARDAKCEALQAELLAEEESEAEARSRKQAKKKAKKERQRAAKAAEAAAAASKETSPPAAAVAGEKAEAAAAATAAATSDEGPAKEEEASEDQDSVGASLEEDTAAVPAAAAPEPASVASVDAANERTLLEKLATLKEFDPLGGEWEQQSGRGKKAGKKKKDQQKKAVEKEHAKSVAAAPVSAPAHHQNGKVSPPVVAAPMPARKPTEQQQPQRRQQQQQHAQKYAHMRSPLPPPPPQRQMPQQWQQPQSQPFMQPQMQQRGQEATRTLAPPIAPPSAWQQTPAAGVPPPQAGATRVKPPFGTFAQTAQGGHSRAPQSGGLLGQANGLSKGAAQPPLPYGFPTAGSATASMPPLGGAAHRPQMGALDASLPAAAGGWGASPPSASPPIAAATGWGTSPPTSNGGFNAARGAGDAGTATSSDAFTLFGGGLSLFGGLNVDDNAGRTALSAAEGRSKPSATVYSLFGGTAAPQA